MFIYWKRRNYWKIIKYKKYSLKEILIFFYNIIYKILFSLIIFKRNKEIKKIKFHKKCNQNHQILR